MKSLEICITDAGLRTTIFILDAYESLFFKPRVQRGKKPYFFAILLNNSNKIGVHSWKSNISLPFQRTRGGLEILEPYRKSN